MDMNQTGNDVVTNHRGEAEMMDLLCRGCDKETESPSHIINRGVEAQISSDIDILKLNRLDEISKCKLKQMVGRICSFLDRTEGLNNIQQRKTAPPSSHIIAESNTCTEAGVK